MADPRIISSRDAFAFGTAFHTLLLEPDAFAETYALLPDCSRLTKAGKEETAAALAAAPGSLFLNGADMKILMDMADGVLAHPAAYELLGQGGLSEVGMYGERDGLPVKARLDLIIGLDQDDGPLIIVDVKTTRDASPDAFREAVDRYGYDAQAAHYGLTVEEVTGREVTDFIFIVVEKSWPYHAGVYRLNPAQQTAGMDKLAEAWERYKECEATQEWPHYGNGAVMTL